MAEVETKPENMVYAKPRLITDEVMHYCPGCSHGTVHKLVAEVIEEMGLEKSTIAVSAARCSPTNMWMWIGSRRLTAAHAPWRRP